MLEESLKWSYGVINICEKWKQKIIIAELQIEPKKISSKKVVMNVYWPSKQQMCRTNLALKCYFALINISERHSERGEKENEKE